MSGGERSLATGRLLAGLAWVVLLLGLWLWGRDLTDARPQSTGPAIGDMAAVGRPPQDDLLPPAAAPLKGALPQALDIPDLGVRAPVVARGLDGRGSVEPPPADRPGLVGWYGAGVRPGAPGTALLVGRAGTGTRPAVFARLRALRPGETVRVLRDDGRAAAFTVEDVKVLTRDPGPASGPVLKPDPAPEPDPGLNTAPDPNPNPDPGLSPAPNLNPAPKSGPDLNAAPKSGPASAPDPRPAHPRQAPTPTPHRSDRAELRLITCEGASGRAGGGCAADVVVSAYLTGTVR
ncbi:sortase domain-bontaining protein [Streptomyces sp. NPDC096152]|uniref:sortase domain-containing protein n=1 Tax=Streptomyces sp. NPDC096152 TaxID=3366078 RepID=UPI00382E6976